MNFDEWGGKRYNSLNVHLKRVFGEKVYRVSLDAGFTCPNRDGTKGLGGCIFCDAGGSRAGYVDPEVPVSEQLRKGIEFIRRTTGANKFIAYFQAFSNTYGPVEKLENLYRSVLNVPGIVGISISTRPDLLPEEVLDLIESLAKETYLWLEIGIQTMKEETLRLLNRGHGLAENYDAITRSKKRSNIRVLTHVILGLPGESLDDMIFTARELSRLGVDGVKMHHLYVIEGTVLHEMYKQGGVKIFEKVEEYAEVAVKFLENLSPHIIIHRLQGFARDGLVAPSWTSNKFVATQKIEQILEMQDTWQGKNWVQKDYYGF